MFPKAEISIYRIMYEAQCANKVVGTDKIHLLHNWDIQSSY